MSKLSPLAPEYLERKLEEYFINTAEPHDWSEEILIYLALAHYAAVRLKKQRNEVFDFDNRELVFRSLERAWRETLYVRLSQPATDFEESSSPFRLTRFGHIEEDSTYLD